MERVKKRKSIAYDEKVPCLSLKLLKHYKHDFIETAQKQTDKEKKSLSIDLGKTWRLHCLFIWFAVLLTHIPFQIDSFLIRKHGKYSLSLLKMYWVWNRCSLKKKEKKWNFI